MMMMIAFVTLNSSLVRLIEDAAQILLDRVLSIT